MSGIEIVGLIVGVIPLLLGATRSYQAALDPVRTVLKPNLSIIKLADFYRNLMCEVTILEGLLESVKNDLPTHRPRSDSLLDEPRSQDLLMIRLGGAYGAFESIIQNNLQVLDHLVSESVLRLPRTTTVSSLMNVSEA